MTHWSEADHRDFMNKAAAKAAKPSKYRNVKVIVDGLAFDSKHEAAVWRELQLRQKAGEISQLERQVACDLFAPIRFGGVGGWVAVAQYIADFSYIEGLKVVVADAKSAATRKNKVYRLKRRWLELQDGIEILEL